MSSSVARGACRKKMLTSRKMSAHAVHESVEDASSRAGTISKGAESCTRIAARHASHARARQRDMARGDARRGVPTKRAGRPSTYRSYIHRGGTLENYCAYATLSRRIRRDAERSTHLCRRVDEIPALRRSEHNGVHHV